MRYDSCFLHLTLIVSGCGKSVDRMALEVQGFFDFSILDCREHLFFCFLIRRANSGFIRYSKWNFPGFNVILLLRQYSTVWWKFIVHTLTWNCCVYANRNIKYATDEDVIFVWVLKIYKQQRCDKTNSKKLRWWILHFKTVSACSSCTSSGHSWYVTTAFCLAKFFTLLYSIVFGLQFRFLLLCRLSFLTAFFVDLPLRTFTFTFLRSFFLGCSFAFSCIFFSGRSFFGFGSFFWFLRLTFWYFFFLFLIFSIFTFLFCFFTSLLFLSFNFLFFFRFSCLLLLLWGWFFLCRFVSFVASFCWPYFFFVFMFLRRLFIAFFGMLFNKCRESSSISVVVSIIDRLKRTAF